MARVLRRDFKDGRPDEWKEKRPRTDGWASATDHSEAFDEYYKGQKICPEEEWDAMVDTFRRPLPTTFRINGTGQFAHDLRDRLQSDFMSRFSDAPLEIDGEQVQPPASLAWYPDGLAWSFCFSRTQLRKVAALEALHEFMKRETAVGAISRQEAVSMVPPLFLDVQPGHRVLDLCAAPGSKTAQLLEALHARGDPGAGCVVANDADARRCNLLTHQTKRMCSPALIVTNHEAQRFPHIIDYAAARAAGLLFDRVLADVPCSGDGTIRKAPDIWQRWTPGNGNGLHTLQLRIALRGAELLAAGGLMVYSTCSLNPIEDEAVVAELLRRTRGALRLVDVAERLPLLKRVPGLASWRVRDRERWYEAWDGPEGGHAGYKLAPSMFPPADPENELHLERCMRFLPHHQDTGGFFVAVLEKVRDLDGDLDYPLAPGLLQPKEGGEAAGDDAGDAAEAPVAEKEEGDQGDEKEEVSAEASEEAQAAGQDTPAVATGEEAQASEEEKTDAAPEAEETKEEVAAEAAAKAAPLDDDEVVEVPVWGAARGGGSRNREGGGGRWHGIDPIVPFADPEHISAMRTFYGMADDCPVPEALISRSTDGKPKRLNYVSPGIKQLLLFDARESLKITAAGVKVFERQESKDGLVGCIYRVAQDGLPILLPFLSSQLLELPLAELKQLLKTRSLALPETAKIHITKKADQEDAEGEAPAPARAAALAPETLEAISKIGYGCCIARLRPADALALGLSSGTEAEGALIAAAPVAISCWRGRACLNVLVSKQECSQIEERLTLGLEPAAGEPKEEPAAVTEPADQ
ncbi:hypothetical protein QBZ16_003721 [Prototheca wickerhamii]|uniref:SAM-dependent MTase RsmB/NOP-type domain-containing protein n=1 Tax=Prototheca wickerhamii TaxID=3111 RepID=A0AAD9MLB9_PROWI|nr:hypothetical protein QBZ16_003721 [Prototheca wickerhamii]